MFRTMIVAASLSVGVVASAAAQGVYMYDANGNYMSGNVSPGGHVTTAT